MQIVRMLIHFSIPYRNVGHNKLTSVNPEVFSNMANLREL